MAKTIVLLHGWSKQAPTKLKTLEAKLNMLGLKTFSFSLPGFQAPEPEITWGVKEYAAWVVNKLKQKKITSPILFGHSFGGQIAAFIASKNLYHLSGLVLCASSSIRVSPKIHKQVAKSLAQSVFISPIKPVPRKLFMSLYPDSDYHQSSPIMQKVLSRVIAQDLSKELPKIRVKTLILWGQKDKTLPANLGKKTHTLIPNSKFILFQNASHSLPYTHALKIAKEIRNFYD